MKIRFDVDTDFGEVPYHIILFEFELNDPPQRYYAAILGNDKDLEIKTVVNPNLETALIELRRFLAEFGYRPKNLGFTGRLEPWDEISGMIANFSHG